MRDRKITRRGLLAGAAGAAVGLTMTTSCTQSAKRSSRRYHGFKIGVCDWTIGQMTKPESLTVAKRLRIDGVQVDFGRGEETLPLFDEGLQNVFVAKSKEQQIEIASLALGVLNDIPYKSDPRAERWVAQSIDVCKAMGTNVVLLAFFGKGDLYKDRDGFDNVVSRLKNIAPTAEKAGVTLGVESWLNADRHMTILERVGSPAVKVYYDVGNSHKMGYDIYEEIRTLGPAICEFHAKDYDNLYGLGSIDFRRVREAMDDAGYRGWVVMEGTKMPLGVEESCRYDAMFLRTVFPRRT